MTQPRSLAVSAERGARARTRTHLSNVPPRAGFSFYDFNANFFYLPLAPGQPRSQHVLLAMWPPVMLELEVPAMARVLAALGGADPARQTGRVVRLWRGGGTVRVERCCSLSMPPRTA